MKRNSDIAIIGGGPAGAAVGTLVARAGFEVALFETGAFPRFHIGESLIPAANLILEKLGVLDALDGLGCPRKHGVQFFSPRGPGRPFYFSEATDPRMHRTWQVLRADFDALLLDTAMRAGVRVLTDARVLAVEQVGRRVTGVKVAGPGGGEQRVAARVVVDASGTKSMLARRLGRRSHIPGLENAALFAHYTGAVRDTGLDAGSTLIHRIRDRAWLWFIPLPDSVSVGLVSPGRTLSSFGKTAPEMLETAIAACRPLAERLAPASRTTDVHIARDFSYRAERDGGEGWLLVGDALGFMDPIYSSGLFLTLLSAELAATAITEALPSASPSFAGYSREYQVAFDRFLALVRAFYQPDFHFSELAGDPTARRGLIDLLTGDVNTGPATAVAETIRGLCATRE